MGTYVNATSNKLIPVIYKCVNCGKENADIATLSATASSRVKLVHDTSRQDSVAYSREILEKKYKTLQADVNNHKFGGLICQGKCKGCGKIQPWAGGRIRALVDKNMLVIMIGLFVLLCAFLCITVKEISMTLILGAAFFTLLFGSLVTLGIRELAGIIGKVLALKGAANMIKDGKEYCMPKIVVPHEDK